MLKARYPAHRSAPEFKYPIQRLARDDDVDEVGGVAVKAVLAQGGAVGFALAMQEQMAARALQFLVEIADVAARIGGVRWRRRGFEICAG